LRAPRKHLIWFEESAHNPPFEEPEKFDRALIKKVLSLPGFSH
jgi:pimeloyl-ACP methyl ester carboxylesterase